MDKLKEDREQVSAPPSHIGFLARKIRRAHVSGDFQDPRQSEVPGLLRLTWFHRSTGHPALFLSVRPFVCRGIEAVLNTQH